MRIAALIAAASVAVILAAPLLSAAPAPRKPVEQIVFASNGDLWAMAPGGGASRRLNRTAALETEPTLSPEGDQLAFVRGGRLIVASAAATAQRVVGEGPPVSSPSWRSRDRLVYAQAGALQTVRLGSPPQPLETPGISAATDPAYSPDGTRIAFSGTGADGNIDVYVLATGALVRVTDHAARDAQPAWSPDGARIAFVSERDGNPELYVAPSSGGEAARLTTTAEVESAPDWSLDGTRIVAGKNGNLAILSLDGQPPRSLGPGSTPDWGLALPPAPAEPTDELLPDLDPQAPSDLSVIAGGGRQLLGFDSAVDSIGRGPMWLRGRRASVRTPLMEARQIVNLTTGGTRIYRRAGSMRYTFSPTHIHWHILDFVRYELRRASDFRLVVRDYKTGFCLGDHYGVAGRRRVTPPRFNGNCGQGRPDLLEVEQGNSVGYSDKYPSYYHGQYVELTRAPAGLYVLVHRANPSRRLRESNYANNASSVLIRLTRANGRATVRVLRICGGTDRCAPAT